MSSCIHLSPLSPHQQAPTRIQTTWSMQLWEESGRVLDTTRVRSYLIFPFWRKHVCVFRGTWSEYIYWFRFRFILTIIFSAKVIMIIMFSLHRDCCWGFWLQYWVCNSESQEGGKAGQKTEEIQEPKEEMSFTKLSWWSSHLSIQSFGGFRRQ